MLLFVFLTNSKFKYRNPKQILISDDGNSKRGLEHLNL